jgi:hypothetical protein
MAGEGPGTLSVLRFTVTRSGDTSNSASVQYATADGTAVAPDDYTPASGTLNFVAGQSSVIIPVATIDDAVIEQVETMTVTLSNPVGATIATATGTGTIKDNESTTIGMQSGPTVTEGGTMTFTVIRAGTLVSTSSVNFATVDGTALAGSDYTATSGTLNFAAGQSSKTISVPTINDAIHEPTETMTVTLSVPVGAALGGATSSTGAINDND